MALGTREKVSCPRTFDFYQRAHPQEHSQAADIFARFVKNKRFVREIGMGIHGLSKVIGDHAPSGSKENEIKNYFGEWNLSLRFREELLTVKIVTPTSPNDEIDHRKTNRLANIMIIIE